ncbi:hypothetical protein CK203_060051 [Vitis vinifera]|uniref:Uncharacterized protein n=1 Tax=Vitis vinifera TaxID=29760 RepID=A0A438GMV0_VITVI|nr:hypothetical protein CK203_060051 [Vitis vinifera]
MWLLSDGFKELVRAWWTGYSVVGSTSHCLVEKLKSLKRDLRKWKKKFLVTFMLKKLRLFLEYNSGIQRRDLIPCPLRKQRLVWGFGGV